MDVDRIDCEGRHVGEEDAAEGICEGGINRNEGEGGLERVILMNLDSESLEQVSISLKD